MIRTATGVRRRDPHLGYLAAQYRHEVVLVENGVVR
jgi:hypothetical protein